MAKSGVRKPKGKAADQPDLGEIRARIDEIDAELHRLMNERASFAQQVGISKHASGRTIDFYRPEREAEVLRSAALPDLTESLHSFPDARIAVPDKRSDKHSDQRSVVPDKRAGSTTRAHFPLQWGVGVASRG